MFLEFGNNFLHVSNSIHFVKNVIHDIVSFKNGQLKCVLCSMNNQAQFELEALKSGI